MTCAVAFAYHDVGVRCLGVLLEAGVEVPLVVTHRDDPNERIWFASVAEFAADRGIETIFPLDPNEPEVIERVRRVAPHFLFSFYYRKMLGRALLELPSRGAFNMHGSLLPKYRGRAPVNWAVLHGERETGATLHEMVEKPDAGRIVDQEPAPIGPDDTAAEVFHRVTEAAETVMRRSLPRLLDGTAKLRAQDLSRGSYFGGRRPEDGRIDWARTSEEIHNLVRAVAPPYPGAFTEIRGARLAVLRTRRQAVPDPPTGPALFVRADACYAVCGDGKTLVLEALALDGRPFTGRDFLARFGSAPIPMSPQ